MLAKPPIITDIVEQHAEDAAFLWCLRDAATDQPHYNLRHLADLEERVEAHVDGLRVAGEAGLAIAWAQLDQHGGPGELFVVAMLSLESRNTTKIERVLQFAESAPKARRGLFGALGWVSSDTLRGQVAAWLDDPTSVRRLVGVVACSLHRADPGSRMGRLLADEPSVRARALRLAGELGRLDLSDRVRVALRDDENPCRFWAAWSAGLLGDRAQAIPALQVYATAEGDFKWRALDLVVRLMDRDTAVDWLRDLGRDPSQIRLLIVAAGIFGDSVVVPWLIQKLGVLALARVAGESFSMITGVDLAENKLDRSLLEGFTGGPTDEPSDEMVAMDPDENLPWPDAVKVESWWQKNAARFAHGVRHLKGSPLSPTSCDEVLREGFQRQRRAAALEQALMSAGRHLWNWRAKSRTQVSSLRASQPSSAHLRP